MEEEQKPHDHAFHLYVHVYIPAPVQGIRWSLMYSYSCRNVSMVFRQRERDVQVRSLTQLNFN